ncbi:uncharacterized protein LOC132461284 isoform X2 [Gadus macrocephalus]|uniref:uncharacterized protein LOC132461284 isoform X2 n=1 Tax=Gadus macrocephalus TaxID=80720 RepID=UPI0028CBB2B6|nr:uncharacterized protein LOC132461284 isoform X2 [Gadus macrocephalus]
MLSFPPHCTHHLQPLDKAVYGPLKRLLASEMDQWHRHHPGKTVTIYDMPSLLNTILLEAASPRNILKGFSSTGIWPLNKDIFPADVFLPASVTDRPPPVIPGPSHDDPSLSLPGPSNTDPSVMCSADLSLSLPGPSNADPSLSLAGPSNADPSLSLAGPSNADPSLSLAGPSNADPSLSLAGPSNADPPVMRRADPSLSLAGPSNADLSLSLPGPAADVSSQLLDGSLTLVFPEFPDLELVTILLGEPEEVVVTTEENEFSPENVRPFPRAGPRKASSSRRKRNTEILTDTPVKEAMEEKKAAPKKTRRGLDGLLCLLYVVPHCVYPWWC